MLGDASASIGIRSPMPWFSSNHPCRPSSCPTPSLLLTSSTLTWPGISSQQNPKAQFLGVCSSIKYEMDACLKKQVSYGRCVSRSNSHELWLVGWLVG